MDPSRQRELALREKELELQIAQERRKEREAELAILQLQRELEQSRASTGENGRSAGENGAYIRGRNRQDSTSYSQASPGRAIPLHAGMSPAGSQAGGSTLGPSRSAPFTPGIEYGGLAFSPAGAASMAGLSYANTPAQLPIPTNDPSSLDMADFSSAFSPDFFNFLPELGGTGLSVTSGSGVQQQEAVNTGYGTSAADVARMTPGQELDFAQFQQDMRGVMSAGPASEAGLSRVRSGEEAARPPAATSQRTRPDADHPMSPPQPGPSSHKKAVSKKETVTVLAACSSCTRPICKLLVRNPTAHAVGVPNDFTANDLVPHFYCLTCAAYNLPGRRAALSQAAEEETTTLAQRKRTRVGEDKAREEEAGETSGRSSRTICDVCQRTVGAGWLEQVDRNQGGVPQSLAMEVVCASCDEKYSRCTDCGGGGGSGRLGVGKWRCKEMFLPGRKTCRLTHSRLGARTMELGVWETPTDIQDPHVMDELLIRCKTMWKEKTLARLAIPEVLECDTDGDPAHPLKSYADIEAKLERGWPIREGFVRNRDNNPDLIRRFMGLIWTPSRTRRGSQGGMNAERRELDGTPRSADGLQTVLPNVKRTHDVIPAGCDLSFQWVGEWNIQAGSLLISTSVPFDGSDGEDRQALSVGEMIHKITLILQSINATRDPPLPPLEHLWVVSRNSSLLIRERLADTLIRKRHFVTVDEYLTRFPSFRASLTDRPGGLHPDLESGEEEHDATTGQPLPPLILVRWLGNTSAQSNDKLNELKQLEFAGGNKVKKGRQKKAAKTGEA